MGIQTEEAPPYSKTDFRERLEENYQDGQEDVERWYGQPGLST
jgi:hypothetical protein